MFHLKDGLFLCRLDPSGEVRIIKTADGKMPDETNTAWAVTVPENEWASVVCSVSKSGETAERWGEQRRFHAGESSSVENATLKKFGRFTRSRHTGFGPDAQDCSCCGSIQNGHGGIHSPDCILAKIFHQPEAIVGYSTQYEAALGKAKEMSRIGVKLNNADGTETTLTNEQFDQMNHRNYD